MRVRTSSEPARGEASLSDRRLFPRPETVCHKPHRHACCSQPRAWFYGRWRTTCVLQARGSRAVCPRLVLPCVIRHASAREVRWSPGIAPQLEGSRRQAVTPYRSYRQMPRYHVLIENECQVNQACRVCNAGSDGEIFCPPTAPEFGSVLGESETAPVAQL